MCAAALSSIASAPVTSFFSSANDLPSAVSLASSERFCSPMNACWSCAGSSVPLLASAPDGGSMSGTNGTNTPLSLIEPMSSLSSACAENTLL
jgi:hypothetical protein